MQVLPQEVFEDHYTHKFRGLALSRGVELHYERDRAGIDLGLHLIDGLEVTHSRVWFQLKGIHKETVSESDYLSAGEVILKLQIDHLQHWYRSSDPVYIIAYLECIDSFLGLDIKELVDGRWGDELFRPETFRPNQQEVHVHISKLATIDETFWSRMLRHRSMQTDGPSYRGNPLGHRYDIRSRIPFIMPPPLFERVVSAVLAEHRFHLEEATNVSNLYIGSQAKASLSFGKLFEVYEWIPRLFAEVMGDTDGYRQDGNPYRVQGEVAVLVHSQVKSRPCISAIKALAQNLVERKIERLLVFVNHYQSCQDEVPYNCFPEFRIAVKETTLKCVPQHLDDLGRTILQASNIYLSFRDEISWRGLSSLKRKHGTIYSLNDDGSKTNL